MKIEKPNPIIVADTEWAKSLPDWLYEGIQKERIINGMYELIGKKELAPKESVGDYEVLTWLLTASNKAPLSSEFIKITCYLTYKIMIKKRKMNEDIIPEEFKRDYIKGLSDYEEKQLGDLKWKIFNSRGGKIKHPILSFLKEFQKQCKKK